MTGEARRNESRDSWIDIKFICTDRGQHRPVEVVRVTDFVDSQAAVPQGARHQRQQPHRVRRGLLPVRRVLAAQRAQHRQRVGDQIRHQILLGVRIVPIDV